SDWRGKGTVVTVLADRGMLRDVTVTDFGSLHDRLDAGNSVQGFLDASVSVLAFIDSRFSFDVRASQGVRLNGNDIESKPLELGLRGDAIRLWATKGAKVSGNRWSHSRDAVSWYSEMVEFSANVGLDSRYSLHSMYSKSLMIRENRF